VSFVDLLHDPMCSKNLYISTINSLLNLNLIWYKFTSPLCLLVLSIFVLESSSCHLNSNSFAADRKKMVWSTSLSNDDDDDGDIGRNFNCCWKWNWAELSKFNVGATKNSKYVAEVYFWVAEVSVRPLWPSDKAANRISITLFCEDVGSIPTGSSKHLLQ